MLEENEDDWRESACDLESKWLQSRITTRPWESCNGFSMVPIWRMWIPAAAKGLRDQLSRHPRARERDLHEEYRHLHLYKRYIYIDIKKMEQDLYKEYRLLLYKRYTVRRADSGHAGQIRTVSQLEEIQTKCFSQHAVSGDGQDKSLKLEQHFHFHWSRLGNSVPIHPHVSSRPVWLYEDVKDERIFTRNIADFICTKDI